MPTPVPHLHLEGQGHQGPGVPQLHLLGAAVGAAPDGRRAVQGSRQKVHDAVQQGLHPQIAQCTAPIAGENPSRQGAPADGGPQRLGLRRLAGQDLVRDRLVPFRRRQSQGLPILREPAPQVRGTGGDLQLLALLPHETNQGSVDQMDDAVPLRQRHRDRDGLRPQAPLHGGQGTVEVGPRAIHLVDEEEGGQVEAAALAPHGLGLGLHPAHRVQHQDAAVLDPHGALHLDGEVHVTGGVDQLDQVVAPRGLGDRGGDGDAVALLLRQVVHVGGTVVDLADLVGGPGVEKDALRECGLARIHVGRDPDGANMRQSRRLFHSVVIETGNCDEEN